MELLFKSFVERFVVLEIKKIESKLNERFVSKFSKKILEFSDDISDGEEGVESIREEIKGESK